MLKPNAEDAFFDNMEEFQIFSYFFQMERKFERRVENNGGSTQDLCAYLSQIERIKSKMKSEALFEKFSKIAWNTILVDHTTLFYLRISMAGNTNVQLSNTRD